MTRRDQFDTLRGLDKAALFVVGDVDVLTPPKGVLAMADATKGSRFVEIANTGHLPPMESPKATNTTLKEFLARID